MLVRKRSDISLTSLQGNQSTVSDARSLLICACQSSSMQAMLPLTVQCQAPPAPAAWIMAPYAPDLTRRMLDELSPSPTKVTGD